MDLIKQEIQEEMESLIKEHKTRIFSDKMVCKIINKSSSTLFRWREAEIKLKYRRTGEAKNSPVEYTARTIAEYIVMNNIKVA